MMGVSDVVLFIMNIICNLGQIFVERAAMIIDRGSEQLRLSPSTIPAWFRDDRRAFASPGTSLLLSPGMASQCTALCVLNLLNIFV